MMPWKGDSNTRPEDSLLCRLCLEGLCENGEATALKCQYCKSTIHTSCLPLVEGNPCITFFNEKKIQYSFFKVFTSLLKSYRNFIVIPEKLKQAKQQELENGGGGKQQQQKSGGGGGFSEEANIVGLDLMPDDWFRKADFLASADRETRAYLTHIVETQNFVQFTLERVELPESDYEILFFDESIKAKLNRSKLKFSKETTPFLKDGAYSIRATITALAPSVEGLDKNKTYSTSFFPLTIDKSLLGTPRKANPLVTEADQNMMRSHTNELVNRTHFANSKRKQDFSKWMRLKLKNFQRPENRLNVSDAMTEEERDQLFDEKLNGVSDCISGFEGAHLASQTNLELQGAIEELHAQQFLLIDMTEAQLVDADNQEAYKAITNRLLQVMTLYKEHLFALENPEYAHPRTPASGRKQQLAVSGGNSVTASRAASPDQQSVASVIATIPITVRSRSESLRKQQPQPPNLQLQMTTSPLAPTPGSPTSSVRGIRGVSTVTTAFPDKRGSTPNSTTTYSPQPRHHATSPPISEGGNSPAASIVNHNSQAQPQQQDQSSERASVSEIQPPIARPRSESINPEKSRHHSHHSHHHHHQQQNQQQQQHPRRSRSQRTSPHPPSRTASVHQQQHQQQQQQQQQQQPGTPPSTTSASVTGTANGVVESPKTGTSLHTAGGSKESLVMSTLSRKMSIAESIDSMMKAIVDVGDSSAKNHGLNVDEAVDECDRAQEELKQLVEMTRKRIPDLLLGGSK
ncbi:hypothetical protein BDR26DRAFT_856006 [Obelidium mucronatum]|nr:hypothetical protein BDR26DRAFT_856006 [Obelidium mucronatum]